MKKLHVIFFVFIAVILIGPINVYAESTIFRDALKASEKAPAGAEQKIAEAAMEPTDGAVEEAVATEDKKQTTEEKFIGAGFGLGLFASFDIGGRKRVESASVVNSTVRVDDEQTTSVGTFLELHYFWPLNGINEEKKEKAVAELRKASTNSVRMNALEEMKTEESASDGLGPFVAVILEGNDDVLAGAALGLMYGHRTRIVDGSSLNIGVGGFITPNAKVLGDGINENEPLPAGETEVRYKNKTKSGIIVCASFKW